MIDYKKAANEARKKILSLIHLAGTSHIASNFSVVDIATVLYENLKEGDEIVWSKGWSAAAIYYFLWKQGKITEEQLNSFPNPPFLGLAETTVPGVWCNGGSVGHGLPIAVGMALGKKRAREKGIVYVIMSDGEWDEGNVWEAALFAGHNKLNNLVAITDFNKWQALGRVKDVLDLEPASDKWKAFNWDVKRINGHEYAEIENSLSDGDKPLMIIANTFKGEGCSLFRDHLLYHYKHVDKETYEKAMAELERVTEPV